MNRKIMLIVLLALAASVTVTAKGATETFEPLIGLTSPNKFYGVYIPPNGELRADTIRIPIINNDWETDIVAGHLFYNVTLNQSELINEATLSLWFELDTLPSPETLTINVYGADAAFSMGATLEGLDRGFPTTDSVITVNLTGITSNQWLNITVTDIVQEIVNKYGWSSGSSLGFIIYGAPAFTARSYQSNVGVNYPRLYVTHGESDESKGNLIEQYRGFEIYLGGGRTLDGNYTGLLEFMNSTSPYNDDLHIYASQHQKRIIYSNYTGLFYAFFTDDTNGLLRYTSFTPNGDFYENGAEFVNDDTITMDLEDYDVGVSMDGKRLYVAFPLDTSEPYDQSKRNTGTNQKNDLVWEVWNITATGQLDKIDDYLISGESPWNGYSRYQNINLEVFRDGSQYVGFCHYTGTAYFERFIINPDRDSFNGSYYASIDEGLVAMAGENRADSSVKTHTMELFGDSGFIIYTLTYGGAGTAYKDAWIACKDFEEQYNQWLAGGYWYNLTLWEGGYSSTLDAISPEMYYQPWGLLTGSGYIGSDSDAAGFFTSYAYLENIISKNNETASPDVPDFDYEKEALTGLEGQETYATFGMAGYNHIGVFMCQNNTQELYYIPYENRSAATSLFNLSSAQSVYNFTEPLYGRYAYNDFVNDKIDFMRDVGCTLKAWNVGGDLADQNTSVGYWTVINENGTTPSLELYRFIFYNKGGGGGGGIIVYNNGTITTSSCIEAAIAANDLEALQKCLDDLLDGAPVDDPDPSGSDWGINYWFSRAKMRLYFFVGGLSFIFLPLWVYVNMTGYDKIRFVWLILLSWVIAASLLLSIRGI